MDRSLRIVFASTLAATIALPAVADAHGLWDFDAAVIERGPAAVHVVAVEPEIVVAIEALGREILVDLEEAPLFMPGAAAGLDPLAGVYYRGTVRSVAESWVSLRLGADGASGIVAMEDVVLVVDEDAASADAQALLFEAPRLPSQALPHRRAVPRGATPVAVLEVAAVADNEFADRYGAGAATRMADVVASFASVFASQLGIEIRIGATMVMDGGPDPFTEFMTGDLFQDFRNAAEEFGEWRESAGGPVAAADLAHLFSDKSFSANPPLNAGFGFFDQVCDVDRGVSVSTAQSPAAASFQGLIFAHEIGHNFDAPHDGDAPCQSAPAGHIMAPAATGSSFSDCTADIIRATRDAAPCLEAPTTTTTSSTTTTSTTTTTVPALCGDANEDDNLTATDALTALRTAVQSADCPLCLCDVDSSGSVLASDALRILRAAVGLAVTLTCVPC